MFTKLCPPQHFLRRVLFYVLYLRENLTSQETLGNTSWLRVGSGGGVFLSWRSRSVLYHLILNFGAMGYGKYNGLFCAYGM